MHGVDVLRPSLILGKWPPYARRPHRVRPGEVAQLFSDTLGSELTEVLP